MNGEVLLDTNVVVAMFAGEPEITTRLGKCEVVFVPSIVIGELYFAAFKSARVGENLSRVDGLVARGGLLGCDAETGRQYGMIKNELRSKGRPIPDNDIWIAGIARQHGLTVITRDGHFDEVERLSVAHW